MNMNDACFGPGKLCNKTEVKALDTMLCCAPD
jgi:hypothetical protein